MTKIVNIFISLIFLTLFIGVQVNKHYSNGKLYSIAVFQEAEDCCAEESCVMDMNSCTSEMQQNIEDCSCKNETDFVKLEDVFVISRFSLAKISSINLLFTTLFITNNIKATYTLNNTFHYFSPPKIEIDFSSLFGVFLC